MFSYYHKERSLLSRCFSTVLVFLLSFSLVFSPSQLYAQSAFSTVLNLPVPGTMVQMTGAFAPVLVKGITIYPDNPLEFDFIINPGDSDLKGKALNKEISKLMKYFLASITTPNDEMWVNLSPYEKDRIVPDNFGDTEMGRDLLTQDYLLKQLTSSLMYPEDKLGQEFWKRVYKKAQDIYGTTEIPMNTFNKIWIVPEKADIYEKGNSVFVANSHLKVMLEEDYVALQNNSGVKKYGLDSLTQKDAKVISGVSSQVVREILIPEIEKEINQGKTFANLRQIYNAAILATWYKTNLQESLLGQVYADKGKTKGVDTQDKQINKKIYNQYVESFKKGVYNYIREDYDSSTKEIIPRKYFSGGNIVDPRGVIKTVSSPGTTKGNYIDAKWRAQDFGSLPEEASSAIDAFNEEVTVASPLSRAEEKKQGGVVGDKLHEILNPDSSFFKEFTQGGYKKRGYGVSAGAVNDGSHAIDDEGNQGYFVNNTMIPGFNSGKDVFVGTVKNMTNFFKNRSERLGKPIKLVIKTGIGGQHTPFQGIADVFHVIDSETGEVVGEYELGKNFEASIEKILREMGVDWDQVAVIPSSKSGSTDETMLVFVQILKVLLKRIAKNEGLDGTQFSNQVLKYLHEINFKDGQEIDKKELFSNFNFDELVGLLGVKKSVVKKVLGVVLGNMFFETTDNPNESRLSAFIRNSGLDKVLGKDAPGFGVMFENVGGRWTGDLHMMTFLAFHGLDAEAYWKVRYEGIKQVRNGVHLANVLGNKILDERIKKIAFVVPDELFWFGKGTEQNFNESIWQEGFANLRAIKASDWKKQSHHYDNDKSMVINVSNLTIDGFNMVEIDPVNMKEGKQKLAEELGRLFTTVYGMTYTVGTQLIARALAKEGFTAEDIDISDLDNRATQILQENLFLRQPFVELGKGLLESEFEALQSAYRAWLIGGKQGVNPIKAAEQKIIAEARNRKAETNINELQNDFRDITDMNKLAKAIKKATIYARENNRTFVPFIYLEGDKFLELRQYLVDLGFEWVLQGTGDQHISYQQVLANPDQYLPFIISFVPTAKNFTPGMPAIGFAKGYLDNISTNMVRDYFGKFSYDALKQQNGRGIFVRMEDTKKVRDEVKGAFSLAVDFSSTLEHKSLGQTVPVKFGTSGHRGIIEDYITGNSANKVFNLPVIRRITQGVADYLKERTDNRTVIIGFDTRRHNLRNAKESASIFAANGFNVLLVPEATPTPVLAYLSTIYDVAGVMNFTASHNPKEDNGFKFSPAHGGAADDSMTKRIGELANEASSYRITDYDEAKSEKVIQELDSDKVVDMYVNDYIIPTLKSSGAWDDIIQFIKDNKNFHLIVDPMQGTAVKAMKAIYSAIEDAAGREMYEMINTNNADDQFTDVNGGPKPDDSKSRQGLVSKVKDYPQGFGISADGDADRFGTVDFGGEFVSADELIGLLTYFLAEEVGIEGNAVIKTVATNDFPNAIIKFLNNKRTADNQIELIEVDVGFKWVVEQIVKNGKKIIIGGEESAHVSVGPFIKTWDDGLAVGLTTLWMVAKASNEAGKIVSLADYKDKIAKIIGVHFKKTVEDIPATDEDKDQLRAGAKKVVQELQASNGDLSQVTVVQTVESLQDQKVSNLIPTIDGGFKFVFESGDTLLMRPSGTQAIIKYYVGLVGKYGTEIDEQRGKRLIEVGKKVVASLASSPFGGINLNPDLLDMQIKRDGKGIPLPIWDQPIESMHIEGFVPIIINVTPVSLPMLLGLNNRTCPNDDSGHANCAGSVMPMIKPDEKV